MSVVHQDDRPRVVEITNIPDVWVDGIARIEPLGGDTFRFLLYRVHRSPDGNVVEHEIVASVLANAACIHASMAIMRALLSGKLELVTMLQ